MLPESHSGATLRLSPDLRLAAAAAGVARYFADAAGMDLEAIARLQEATLLACAAAFEFLSGENPLLTVAVTKYADRIEVAIAHHREDTHALGLDVAAGSAASFSGHAPASGGVDRVQYEAQGGESVTRLTKYIGRVAPNV